MKTSTSYLSVTFITPYIGSSLASHDKLKLGIWTNNGKQERTKKRIKTLQ